MKKTTKQKSTRAWSGKEKFRAVSEASKLPDDKLGAFLRHEGLHEAQLKEWRTQVLSVLGDTKPKKRTKSPEEKKIRKIEQELIQRDRELIRKDQTIAELTALYVLKKKLIDYYSREDEDSNTTGRSGR